MRATNAEGVCSSDWIREWEAALAHVEKAVVATPLTALDDSTWAKASMVMRYLESISGEARSHSQIA